MSRFFGLDFEPTISRMQGQVDMIGGKLLEQPVLHENYISYYFKIDNDFVFKTLKGYLFSNLAKGHVEKVKDKEQVPEILKLHERIKSYEEETGLSASSVNFLPLSKESGILRVDFPVSRQLFIDFYNNDTLSEPPPYFFDAYAFVVERAKKTYRNNLKKYHGKEIPHEELDQRFDYTLYFIRSERRSTFYYPYAVDLGKFNPSSQGYLNVSYKYNGKYTQNQNVEDLYLTMVCRLGPQIPFPVGMKPKKPFMVRYDWKDYKKCKPYKHWVQCHVRKNGLAYSPPVDCTSVPPEEPELCQS